MLIAMLSDLSIASDRAVFGAPELRRLAGEALADGGQHLGARVAILHTPKKGRIVIEYRGNEDLQRLLEKFGVEA